PSRITRGYGIKPTAAARPASDCAVFLPALANVLADGVVLLGRKWPAADARRIRFEHADDLRDPPRGDTRSARHPDPGAVAARHKRKRAMIDIKQGPLRTLEEQPLAVF